MRMMLELLALVLAFGCGVGVLVHSYCTAALTQTGAIVLLVAIAAYVLAGVLWLDDVRQLAAVRPAGPPLPSSATEVAGYGLAAVYWDDDPPRMYDVGHGKPPPQRSR